MIEEGGALSESDRITAFHELLSTMTRAPDVREVFQHLSEIARRIVLHDEANLLLTTDDGAAFTLYTSTMDGGDRLSSRGRSPDGQTSHQGPPRLPGPRRD
jgi:hypothetical protein